jgi:hypothetical protein
MEEDMFVRPYVSYYLLLPNLLKLLSTGRGASRGRGLAGVGLAWVGKDWEGRGPARAGERREVFFFFFFIFFGSSFLFLGVDGVA